MASRKKRKKSAPSAGFLVLALCMAAMALLFAIKYQDIRTSLEKTKFFDLIRKNTLSEDAATRTTLSPGKQTSATTTTIGSSLPTNTVATGTLATDSTSAVGEPPASTESYRFSSLYFVTIEEDGLISRKEVKRAVPASDSPLTDSLDALLKGPNEGEIRAGLVSLIPGGTKLLGVNLRGSTAEVNLTEAFMYNNYGIEGYSAQLRQIVYTATAFPSVHDVQILIDGKKRDYLGGEGVYIGEPLSRNSF